MTNDGAKRVRFSSYEVDLETGELWKHGVALKIAGQPFEILAYLVDRPGQLVSREELRAQLWPHETFVDFDHGLNAAVNRLRLALCDSAEDPKYIETLPRRGYRFIAAVEEVASEITVSEAAAEEPVAALHGGVRTGNRDIGWQGQCSPLTVDAAPDAGFGIPEAAVVKRRWQKMFSNLWGRRFWLLCAGSATLAVVGFWLFGGRLQLGSNPQAKIATVAGTPILLSSLTSFSDRTSQPAFSPDGSRVAFVREGFLPRNTGIWTKQVSGDELIQLTNNGGDCCPVWSPDGQWVTFSRISGRERKVFRIAANGRELRELFASDAVAGHGELDWSPDGKAIAYVADGQEGSSAIFLRPLADQKLADQRLADQRARQVSSPSALERDWGPAFSSDGSRLVFVRNNQEVMVISIEGREIQRLFKTPGHIMGSPAWTPDGQSIVFAASNGEGPNLMRISAAGGKATNIREAGDLALNPAIARRGFRLACDELTVTRSIDQIDFDHPGQKVRRLVTTAGGENTAIQISHDGTKLVFQSDRAGESEIWVSDRDGQDPVRMTAIGEAGSPRWSPDDKEIVFESGAREGAGTNGGVFLIKSSGGEPRSLIQDSFSNRAPRWSNDGKWIYFGSNRSGKWQVWKVPAWGGTPVQVTRSGGFAAEESLDGKFLFYVKQERGSAEIWKMAAAGGGETLVNPAIHPLDWGAWTIVKDGLLFVEPGVDDDPSVSLYDFSSERMKRLAALDKPPFWITATRDGRSVIFDQPGQFESHVALLENFR